MWLCTHVVSYHLHKMSTDLVFSPLPMRLPPPSSDNYTNALSNINNSAILEYSQYHPGGVIKMVYDNTLSVKLLRCLDTVLDTDAHAREIFEREKLTFEENLQTFKRRELCKTRPHDEPWVDKLILTPFMEALADLVEEICPGCSSEPSAPKRGKMVKPDYIYSGMIGEWKSPYKLPAAAIDLKRRIDELSVLVLHPDTAQSDDWARLANKVT